MLKASEPWLRVRLSAQGAPSMAPLLVVTSLVLILELLALALPLVVLAHGWGDQPDTAAVPAGLAAGGAGLLAGWMTRGRPHRKGPKMWDVKPHRSAKKKGAEKKAPAPQAPPPQAPPEQAPPTQPTPGLPFDEHGPIERPDNTPKPFNANEQAERAAAKEQESRKGLTGQE
jgi:hypothetical protein